MRVALVGPYSAGKTSLIKRFLFQWGTPIPDDLAVAADPTTFEVQVIDSRVTFVDTPGTGNDRPEHAARAIEQAIDADLVLLVLTYQLMSGSDEALWSLLDGSAWRTVQAQTDPASMRIVVNRFDEAGADPTEDLPGYEERAQLKRAEMQDIIQSRLRDGEPMCMHIVAADPGGLVYTDTPSDPDAYAGGPWDGIEELLADIESSTSQLPTLRSLRAVRVRGHRLIAQQAEIDRYLPTLHLAVTAARKDHHDLQSHLAELRRLQGGFDADLRERLARSVGADAAATTAPDREVLVRHRLKMTIDDWAQSVTESLHRFAQHGPAGLTDTEPPLIEAIEMGRPDESACTDDTFWHIARGLHDNADAVKETAKACRELLDLGQKLKPLGNVLRSEAVEAGLKTLDLALKLSDQGTEDAAMIRKAENINKAFVKAATEAADESAAPLWQWISSYQDQVAGHQARVFAALEAAQHKHGEAIDRQETLGQLFASMPATDSE